MIHNLLLIYQSSSDNPNWLHYIHDGEQEGGFSKELWVMVMEMKEDPYNEEVIYRGHLPQSSH